MGSQNDTGLASSETYFGISRTAYIFHKFHFLLSTFSKIENTSESLTKWTVCSFTECDIICFTVQPPGPSQKWVMVVLMDRPRRSPSSSFGFLPAHAGKSKENPKVLRQCCCYPCLMYSMSSVPQYLPNEIVIHCPAGWGVTHTVDAQLCSRLSEQHVPKSWGRKTMVVSETERTNVAERGRVEVRKRERERQTDRERERVVGRSWWDGVGRVTVQNEAQSIQNLMAMLRSFVFGLRATGSHGRIIGREPLIKFAFCTDSVSCSVEQELEESKGKGGVRRLWLRGWWLWPSGADVDGQEQSEN